MGKVMISPHFSMSEALRTSHDVDNSIPTEKKVLVTRNMSRLAYDILEPWRELVGPLGVNSWFRSPALNVKVGGEKTSAHMTGRAADVFSVEIPTLEAFKILVLSNIPFDRSLYEHKLKPDGTESIWVHTQVSQDPSIPPLKWVFEGIPGPTGRMIYPRIWDIKSFVPKKLSNTTR